MIFSIFASLLLAGNLVLAATVVRPLEFEFRPLRDGESDYRALGRSSILYGPTEFRVAVPAPHRISAVTIVGEGRDPRTGREEVLCRSSEPPDRCSVDFGTVSSRHRFRIDAEVHDPEGGVTDAVSERFITLDTHPLGSVTSSRPTVFVERTRTEALPPDEVRRLVRVERPEGKGEDRSIFYRDDLTRQEFRVNVAGIRDAKVISVQLPNPERRKLIPILFNVATYLMTRSRGQPGLGWQNHYRQMVLTLAQGLRAAAKRGVDVEYVVVPYAATARVFGPFRLHPGDNLDASARSFNEETLASLEQFLREPPLPAWQEKYRERWVDNFAGMIHTLNDLYLRQYDGLVQAVWITGGWSNPAGPVYRFQEEMWPERLAELNPEWNDAKMLELFERLDEGKDSHHEAMENFIESLDSFNPPTAARITNFMRAVDPGALDTLHPHRVDSSPVINVLFVPSSRSLRADHMLKFSTFIQQRYGGEIFRLLKVQNSGAEQLEERLVGRGQVKGTATVAQVLKRTYEQLVHSYVIDLEVANPDQDGARHELRIGAVEPAADGKVMPLKEFETAYMPTYTSSGSVLSRLFDYLRSGFKDLRLLSAYELRNYWLENDVLPAWAERWQVEQDDQVRSVLFESWISINLKRLQNGGSGKKQRKGAEEAYGKLRRAGDLADQLSDPSLARQAGVVAEWYRADHPELFGETTAAAN